MRVTILGAGAMGAALTFPVATKCNTPVLYGTKFDKETLDQLRDGKPHPKLRQQLPDEDVELRYPDDLEGAIEGAEICILGVNTSGILPLMNALLPHLKESIPLVIIAKGLVDLEGKALPAASAARGYLRMKAVPHPPPVVSMVGPSIAAEVADIVPTIVHVASENEDSARQVAEFLSTPRFHCRYDADAKGIEICSAYKNIYTIALSWPAGLSEQDGPEKQSNLKSILFLQTLDEMRLLSLAAGGRADTPWSIAGLGDLLTTAESGRNGAFGKKLGSGKSTDEALDELAGQGIRTIEGYETAKLGLDHARALDPDIPNRLPLLRAINDVINGDHSVRQALDSLDLGKIAMTRVFD